MDPAETSGDIYILSTPTLTTLASIPKRVRSQPGTHGRGTWQNGRSAPPTIIDVPLDTVVCELPRDDPRRAKDTREEAHEGLGVDRATWPMHLDLSEVEQVVEDVNAPLAAEYLGHLIARGKSTLLRALTGGRAKTEVASHAFTALNPVVGVIRVADDGTFEGKLHDRHVFEETAVEEARRRRHPRQ
ncbi:hypothetical protein EV363DRAFT_1555223 [Boletus edulis]|nr:hypothetical protein EV363DRAFT_1555223 [Boletus edulis]